MSRRVRYEVRDGYSCAYAITLGEEYSMPSRYESRADENSIHGGDHFIAEGERSAEKANRQVKRMFIIIMGLLTAAFLLWKFGL